jgi:hypothetical protein
MWGRGDLIEKLGNPFKNVGVTLIGTASAIVEVRLAYIMQ